MYKVYYGKKEKEFNDFGKALQFAIKKVTAEIWFHGQIRNELVSKYHKGWEVKE